MDKKDKGLILIIIGVLLLFVIGIHTKLSVKENNEIPNDYIAIFHGGVGERTYETYIYKIDNGQPNMGFKYINVTSTTTSYGSPRWEHRVTERGTVDFTDGVFNVAEKNHAYSYVTVPKSNETYTIEEFQAKFIMN